MRGCVASWPSASRLPLPFASCRMRVAARPRIASTRRPSPASRSTSPKARTCRCARCALDARDNPTSQPDPRLAGVGAGGRGRACGAARGTGALPSRPRHGNRRRALRRLGPRGRAGLRRAGRARVARVAPRAVGRRPRPRGLGVGRPLARRLRDPGATRRRRGRGRSAGRARRSARGLPGFPRLARLGRRLGPVERTRRAGPPAARMEDTGEVPVRPRRPRRDPRRAGAHRPRSGR